MQMYVRGVGVVKSAKGKKSTRTPRSLDAAMAMAAGAVSSGGHLSYASLLCATLPLCINFRSTLMEVSNEKIEPESEGEKAKEKER